MPSRIVLLDLDRDTAPRVVGFGKSSVYLVTPDDDDVEWIERYALPAIR
jgi:hypothetical protein